MRAALGFLCVMACFSAVHGAGAESKKDDKPRVRLLVPAYFYPAGEGLKEWDKLFHSPARADTVVIVNPASGPGLKADPNYTDVCQRGVKAGVMLIGYVSTSYGKRPIVDMKADIDRWTLLYPGIRGVFLDEQPGDDGHVEVFATLYRYIREHKNLELVITNPGAVCSERYLSRPATDAACLFEGPLGPSSLNFPAWATRDGSNRIAALPYGVATAEPMRDCLRKARSRGIGFIYVTDATAEMPWGRLPRYWDAETAEVREINGR